MQLSFNKSFNLQSSILLIAPFFLWGTAMVAMKGTIANTTPLFMAAIRILPAGLLVLLVAAIQKRSQPQTLKAWFWIGVFALIDGTLFQGFLAEGLMRTDAGLGSVTIDSQPLAVALLSRFLFQEVIGFWGFVGLAVGILGISLVGFPDEWFYSLFGGNLPSIAFNWDNLFDNGEWLMLLASFSMAIGTVVIRYVSKHADPVVATGWHMVLGGIPLILGSCIWEDRQWQNIHLDGWVSIAYATIFGSAIAYGLFFYLASRQNLTSLSSLTFLTPVFALLFGNLFLGEVLSLLQGVGVCLTLVSIYLINQREKIASQLLDLLTTKSNILKTEAISVPTETINSSNLE
jgi:drug/metabolite transporter (DMT)-like permease